MPNVFVELSEQLAREKGIRNGDKVLITTTRGDITALACVTKRFKPMTVQGKTIHHIGVLWHFGFNELCTGDPANRLTPHIGDGNTMIPEYKAWLSRHKEGLNMVNLTNLYDVSKCTACRACQVACKDWNQLPAVIEPFKGNYQTHEDTNADTYTIVRFIEHEDDPVEGVQWNFLKYQCMHCHEPECVRVCPRGAYTKTEWGATVHNPDRCIGCQYCTYACPFHIPKYQKEKRYHNQMHILC